MAAESDKQILFLKVAENEMQMALYGQTFINSGSCHQQLQNELKLTRLQLMPSLTNGIKTLLIIILTRDVEKRLIFKALAIVFTQDSHFGKLEVHIFRMLSELFQFDCRNLSQSNEDTETFFSVLLVIWTN